MERAPFVCGGLVLAYVVAIGAMWATSSNGLDALGRPLGTDFSNVWAAGRLVLEGAPAAPYDLAAHYAEQVKRFGAGVPFYGWHYPPMFLFLAAALGALPYIAALIVWQAATLPLYLAAIVRILGARRAVLLAAVAFPAVFVNLTHGHNGFLTAGLFGLGLVMLDRRPLLAGALLGLLAYKPQFAALLPLALIASGRWPTFFAAAAAAATSAALSLAAFGWEAWAGFFASGTFTRTVVLEAGDTGWHKIVTAFAAARGLGASVPAAYAVQGIVAFATVVLIVRLWRGDAPFGPKAAALLAGSLLVTPYALDYDMMLLAPALAFLVRDASATGWRRGETVVLAFVYLSPLVARTVAEATHLPLGLFAIAALFAAALRRGGASVTQSGSFAHAVGR
ncbi:glycosyltransferase family 87 protein [Hansschlegelia quercus]|nr:glycosyltransferase family 87 protein [Hansschlegelia quercus]